MSSLLRCCQHASVGLLAIVGFFLLLLARETYNDEDHVANGAVRGAPGKLRCRVYSHAAHGRVHPADGNTFLVSSLEGLVRDSSRQFSMDVDRVYTNDGLSVSSLWVKSAGRSCLFDGKRCIFDGSSLHVLERGVLFAPIMRQSDG